MTESGEHFLQACKQLPLGDVGQAAAAIVAQYVQSHTAGAIHDAGVAENTYIDAGTPAVVIPTGTNYELRASAWPHHFRIFAAFGETVTAESEVGTLAYFSMGRTSPQFAEQPMFFLPIVTYSNGASQWDNDSYKFDGDYDQSPELFDELYECSSVLEMSRNQRCVGSFTTQTAGFYSLQIFYRA